MSTEIVVFAIYIDGVLIDFYDTKEDAEHHIAHALHGGIVVMLTGKMPKVARKFEFEGYMEEREFKREGIALLVYYNKYGLLSVDNPLLS